MYFKRRFRERIDELNPVIVFGVVKFCGRAWCCSQTPSKSSKAAKNCLKFFRFIRCVSWSTKNQVIYERAALILEDNSCDWKLHEWHQLSWKCERIFHRHSNDSTYSIVDTLIKLADTRANTSGNLLNFLASMMTKKFPASKAIFQELPSIERASRG